MADYGVNIAVAVKNTQAITKLSRDTDLLGQKIRNVNDALERFGDLNGKTVVNSVANFNKELAKAAENFNNVRLGSDRAADAARNFARAQDLANDALREQAALLAEVRNQGRSGTLRGGTQYGGPIGPGFGGFPATRPEDISVPAALRSRLPPSVPVALRSPMRPQSLLPQMGMTAQAGQIASDMEEVYASILRLTEKANQEEAQKLQTLRQGTQEVEALAQKYRVVNEAQKTGKQLQLQIRRNILETKAAAAEEARIANQGFLDRLRNLEAVGAERRKQFIEFNEEENEKRQIRLRELDFEERLAKVQKRNRDRAERGRRAVGSALIGGAFPALFGQGAGASVGGGFGGLFGGILGGEFGFGLSLVGTAFGQAFDDAVAFNDSLNQLNVSFEITGSSAKLFGRDIDEIARVLKITNEEAVKAAGAFSFIADPKLTKAATKIFGEDKAGLSLLMGVKDAETLSKAVGQIFERNKSVAESLKDQLVVNGKLLSIDKARIKVLEAFIRLRFGSLTKEQDITLPGAMGSKRVIGTETVPVIPQEAQEALALLGEAKRELEEAIFQPESGARGGSKADPTIALTKRLEIVNSLIAAEKEVIGLVGESANIVRRKLAFEAKIAQIQATGRAERQKLKDQEDIILSNTIQANSEKLAQLQFEREIAVAVERSATASEKTLEPVQRKLDALKDRNAFEREYGQLIMSGSTPAAAKQAIEAKKQAKEIDELVEKQLRSNEIQINILRAIVAQAVGTDAHAAAQEALNDALERENEIREKGKKAKGEIKGKKTPVENIEEEMRRIQGQINTLMDPASRLIAAANAIGDAFASSFRGIVDGSMSAREALANLFQRTAGHFLDMAAQMIAAQIKMKILGIGLNLLGGAASGGGTTPPTTMPGASVQTGPGLNINGVDQFIAPPTIAASGGYFGGPTRALIGEGGQGEYVIPENKMRESMLRYSRGARGSAVVPETGASGTSGEGGGTAVAAPIDVRFNVERINNVDYVTAEQFQVGLARAAQQGAAEGERRAMGSLRNSAAVRRRIGV